MKAKIGDRVRVIEENSETNATEGVVIKIQPSEKTFYSFVTIRLNDGKYAMIADFLFDKKFCLIEDK